MKCPQCKHEMDSNGIAWCDNGHVYDAKSITESELANTRFVMDRRGDEVDKLHAALRGLLNATARARKADDAVSRNSGLTADWDEHEDAHASLIICENEARALLPVASPLTARSG